MDAFEHDYVAGIEGARRWALTQAAGRLPPVATTPRSAPIYQHGRLLLKLFVPHRTDPQQPHTRDELYLVAQGRGGSSMVVRATRSSQATCCSSQPASCIDSRISATT